MYQPIQKMPKHSAKTKEEPCEDWEDQDYDLDTSLASHTPDEEDPTTRSKSINTSGSSDPSTSATSNALLWTCANKNPQYVIIPSNSSAPNPVSTSNRSVSPVAPLAADIKEREKAYLEARERIFNGTSSEPDPLKRPDSKGKSSGVSSLITSRSEEQVMVKRQPKGPSEIDLKGFKNRTRTEM
ncbi:hypothetical protein DFH28DRAFT_966406 [Melampsora americana]|nr:hypothetical protein DFH28DRAFT_966406 [Melampsora americana]